MRLEDICRCVYPACPNIKSQKKFIEELFKAAGSEPYISDTYKKGLFSGDKPFIVSQKSPLRGKDNIGSLIQFFDNQINDAGAVLVEFGVPVKDEPNKKALAIALARQMKLLIESDTEDVEDIVALEYQQARQNDTEMSHNEFIQPLYKGDSVSVYHSSRHEIQSYASVTHVWELLNTGKIIWSGRKLVYKRGPKDRPEAHPNVIDIPDVKPNGSIKISTTIDGRGFDGVTHCKWEMQDSDGENCFPERDSLFCVTIDARFKRN